MAKKKKLIQSRNSVGMVLGRELRDLAPSKQRTTVGSSASDGINAKETTRHDRAPEIDKLLKKLDGRHKVAFKKLAL